MRVGGVGGLADLIRFSYYYTAPYCWRYIIHTYTSVRMAYFCLVCLVFFLLFYCEYCFFTPFLTADIPFALGIYVNGLFFFLQLCNYHTFMTFLHYYLHILIIEFVVSKFHKNCGMTYAWTKRKFKNCDSKGALKKINDMFQRFSHVAVVKVKMQD